MKQSFILLVLFFTLSFNAQITSFQEVGNLPSGLQEISGSVYYNQSLYALNDSGSDAFLIEYNPHTGEEIRGMKILGATNKDWEAMASDESYIYIGDIGNNAGNRQDLTIYRMQKCDTGNSSIASDSFTFSYSDQCNFNNEYQNHNYDAEAMVVIGDNLFIFTKNWADHHTKVYQIAKDGSQEVANLVADYNVNTLISDACYDPQNNRLVLVGYSETLQPQTLVFENFCTTDLSSNTFETYALPIDFGTVLQVEAISYLGNNEFAIGNEYFSDVVSGFSITSEAKVHTFLMVAAPQVAPAPTVQTTIFPNPSTDFISIDTSGDTSIDNVQIYDLNGIAQTTLMDANQTIDVQTLNAGIYLLQIQTNQGIQTKTFIKN